MEQKLVMERIESSLKLIEPEMLVNAGDLPLTLREFKTLEVNVSTIHRETVAEVKNLCFTYEGKRKERTSDRVLEHFENGIKKINEPEKVESNGQRDRRTS